MSTSANPAEIAPGASVAWAVALSAPLPQGWRREEAQTRFEQPELRLWRGEEWVVSAVLHPDWVVFYLRRPFFRSAALGAQTVTTRFPAARIDKGAVKLRVTNAVEAEELCRICLPLD